MIVFCTCHTWGFKSLWDSSRVSWDIVMSCMELLVINLVSLPLPTLQPRTSAFGHPPPNPQIFLDTHSRRLGWGGKGFRWDFASEGHRCLALPSWSDLIVTYFYLLIFLHSALDKWHLDFFDCNRFTFSVVTQTYHMDVYSIYITHRELSQMNGFLLCVTPSDIVCSIWFCFIKKYTSHNPVVTTL